MTVHKPLHTVQLEAAIYLETIGTDPAGVVTCVLLGMLVKEVKLLLGDQTVASQLIKAVHLTVLLPCLVDTSGNGSTLVSQEVNGL